MDRPSDMQPARAPIRLTHEEYLQFPDDGRRHELIDGEHFVTPAPTRRHQRICLDLASALNAHVRTHRLGEVYSAPMDVILSEHDVLQPDILFVSNERREVLGKWVHGAPDLAVEILSPSSRRLDEVTKRRVYERFGVRELWVIDPEIEVLRLYRQGEAGAFERPTELRREDRDTLQSTLLPGFSLPLGELFAE
jgi:Uma2 family endonuclease